MDTIYLSLRAQVAANTFFMKSPVYDRLLIYGNWLLRIYKPTFKTIFIFRHGDGVKDVSFTVEDIEGIMEKCKVKYSHCTVRICSYFFKLIRWHRVPLSFNLLP
jgi:hypothetical protein